MRGIGIAWGNRGSRQGRLLVHVYHDNPKRIHAASIARTSYPIALHIV
jgi:hypothetical protein